MYSRDYFGENCVLYDTKRTLNVVALSNLKCYEISIESLEETLGTDYRQVILNSIFLNDIKQNSFFADLLLDSNIKQVFGAFALKVFNNKEVVFDTPIIRNKKVILILQGNLVNVNKLN